MKRPAQASCGVEINLSISGNEMSDRRFRPSVALRRPGKKAILGEFVKVTGYHRKHAIRIMNGTQVAEEQKPVGERIHQAVVDEALIVLWVPKMPSDYIAILIAVGARHPLKFRVPATEILIITPFSYL